MPTYDYKCMECNFTFEELQKMTDEPLKICPKCSGKLNRLIGAGAAPIFKGSGFYQTDYKNSKNSSENTVKKDTNSEKDSSKKETKKEVKSSTEN
ncbi:MAG: zinc ribbon domain-containing protein [Ignavibacteriae bacterium]|nr:zinc ribbon domain-containing protein [Ignavibacteriota bacterium]